MKKTDRALIDLIGGPFWGLNKTLVRVLGIDCALWLADIFSKYLYFKKEEELDDDGYFFNTQSKIEEDTTLSPYQQNNVIKKLKGLSIIDVKRQGIPAKNYYKINVDKLLDILDSSYLKTKELESEGLGNLSNKNKGNNNKEINTSSKEDVVPPSGGEPLSSTSPPDKPVMKKRNIPPSERPPFVPDNIKEILAVWNGSGLRRHRDPTSKVYKEAVHALKKLMRGAFFYENPVGNGYQDRKFTKDEVLMAVENFKLAALNMDYEPAGGYKEKLRKTSLKDFLYNPFSENGAKSLFVRYFEGPPELLSESERFPKTDEYPDVTKELARQYVGRIKGGVGGVSARERSKLVAGAAMIARFYEEYEREIDPLFVKGVRDMVTMVVDGLTDYYDDVRVGNFCSAYTYETVMPTYLERQAVLR